MSLIITSATEQDMAVIHRIYSHYVLHTTASLEEVPPSVEELNQRRISYQGNGYPYLVIKSEGNIAGYTYAAPFRPRSGYRFTVEDSIYIDQPYQGKGIGRMLLEELIARCTRIGFREMVGVIGGKDNTASITLHERAGFTIKGIIEGAGFKHNHWISTVIMQRPLGEGHHTPPVDLQRE